MHSVYQGWAHRREFIVSLQVWGAGDARASSSSQFRANSNPSVKWRRVAKDPGKKGLEEGLGEDDYQETLQSRFRPHLSNAMSISRAFEDRKCS